MNKNFSKTRRLVFLLLGVSMTGLRAAKNPFGPFYFSVTKKGSSINETLKISDKRQYNFYIDFYYTNEIDYQIVRKLSGGPSRNIKDNSYSEPGVIVPIKLVVSDINGVVLHDAISTISGTDIHGFLPDKAGFFSRYVTSIVLNPGTYVVNAEIMADTKDLSEIKSSLSIKWAPNTKPLDN